jgi:hypothetical protein
VIFIIEGQSGWLFSRVNTPNLFHFQGSRADTCYFALVFNIHVNPPVAVGDGKFRFTVERDRRNYLVCLSIDHGGICSPSVKGKYFAAERIIEYRIRILSGRINLVEEFKSLQVNNGNRRFSAVAYKRLVQVSSDCHPVNTFSTGNGRQQLTVTLTDYIHHIAMRNEDPASRLIDRKVIPSAVAFNRKPVNDFITLG